MVCGAYGGAGTYALYCRALVSLRRSQSRKAFPQTIRLTLIWFIWLTPGSPLTRANNTNNEGEMYE